MKKILNLYLYFNIEPFLVKQPVLLLHSIISKMWITRIPTSLRTYEFKPNNVHRSLNRVNGT